VPSLVIESRKSRVAVVTGGGSGIGEATCRRLAARGDRVAILDLDGEGAERLAKDLRNDGASVLALAADVADRVAVDAAFDRVRDDLGPVEILVTSAGLCDFSPFHEVTVQQWQRAIDVNLTGTFHACQAALDDMLAASWGRIVLISSSSAQRGSPKAPHYAAAKGGVISLCRSLALTYATSGITVNTIPPSGIETPMQHAAQAAGDLPSNETMAGAIPMGYLGTPDDLAVAVEFLTSDDARYITGQVLGVNGGAVVQ
jgi:2-hydroxycyclohexanecarboxyl-CoA dehydrogenase